ncbi:MAG: hypothetical protein WCS03_18550 [Bacteroidota bacterium]
MQSKDLLILGGGHMIWGEVFLNMIRKKFYELARVMIFDKIEIVESEAKCDSGFIGTAALLLE